jgi:acyl-CoA reductase-like NAD-dependent aldehyde dehydrogenase
MCTAPHHILIPAAGVETPEGLVPFDEVAQRYAAAVDALAQNPKAGPFVLGAIQNKVTLERLGMIKGKELLASKTIAHPQFEGARILSPLVLEADESQYEAIAHEIFGPAVLVVKCTDLDSAISLARRMAVEKGALSGAVYVTDEDLEEEIAYALNSAGIPVSFNLTGGIYMNQNAAFSDYHVTGGNPAGNGSIGDPSFVLRRFFRVGNKFGNLRGRNG